jgi:hypothetical protein
MLMENMMDSQQNNERPVSKKITFPNGNCAQLVVPPAGTPPASILKALGIGQPKALIMVAGGAGGLDETPKPRLVQLCSWGIARAAVEMGAIIIDGGTQAGVMAMIGKGVADRGRKSVLLGFAPAGKVTYPGGPGEGSIADSAPLDPNHSHFVVVESEEWGGETETMYELAEELGKQVPVLTVLINGGEVAKSEVLRTVRHGWPIITIEGTGRLADEIADLSKKTKKSHFVDDPLLAEIVADGEIHLFHLDSPIEELERFIRQLLGLKKDPTLKMAWERFGLYDMNAMRQQTSFNRIVVWILCLGIVATLLALSQTQLETLGLLKPPSWDYSVLRYAIIAVPIVLSILMAVANRFRAGNKWILLRANAESIKREIYRYRTQAEIYGDQQKGGSSPETQLVHKVEAISRRLMRTDVNLSALRPYEGPIPPKMYGAAEEDDGFSQLSPERYITVRLGDQLNYYRLKTTKLERQLKRLQWLIYIFGGIGTLLAAVGWELWVALTTSLAGAFTTFLEYQQVENSLMKYNQAATDLANLQAWWTALSTEEKADGKSIDKLVSYTEKILEGELTGWVQRMEDALAELRAEQAGELGLEGSQS